MLTDGEVARLIETHKIPVLDAYKFATSLRIAFEIYERDRRSINANQWHDEIAALYRAAERANVAAMFPLLANLSPEPLASLEARSGRIGVALPRGDELTNDRERQAACEAVARLCRVGGGWVEGKLRSGGRRSKTWKVALYAPYKSKYFSKREAERLFTINLQLAWLEATGKPPATSASWEKPGPFARFLDDCLKLAGCGHVNAVKTITRVAKHRPPRKKC